MEYRAYPFQSLIPIPDIHAVRETDPFCFPRARVHAVRQRGGTALAGKRGTHVLFRQGNEQQFEGSESPAEGREGGDGPGARGE